MFCPNCGKDCGEFKFCPECGQELQEDVATQTVADRKKWLQAQGQLYCPKCLSTSVKVMEYKNQYIYHSPFAALFWLVGAMINKRLEKRDGLECICLKCDYRWYTKRQAMREKHAVKTEKMWKEYPISLESYIALDEEGVTLGNHGRKQWVVAYENIVAVEYRKGLGPLKGRLSLLHWGTRRKKFPRTFEEAKGDDFTVFFTEYWEKEMYQIYLVLKTIADENKKAGMF